MGRMHSNGKGKSRSALPYKRSPPSWLKITTGEVRQLGRQRALGGSGVGAEAVAAAGGGPGGRGGSAGQLNLRAQRPHLSTTRNSPALNCPPGG